jgi:hypothetical protein
VSEVYKSLARRLTIQLGLESIAFRRREDDHVIWVDAELASIAQMTSIRSALLKVAPDDAHIKCVRPYMRALGHQEAGES